MGKKIPLVEKFGPTIQGEGATIGMQTYFLRFGLCDYECAMCDSMHAVDPKQVKTNAKWLTQTQIADLFLPCWDGGCHWITFSGGNPCIHELTELVVLLRAKGYMITVETQGTFAPEWLTKCHMVTVSPKGPGMGEQFEPDKFYNFIKCLKHRVRLSCKVVIFGDADIEFAAGVAKTWGSEGYTMDGFYLSQGNPYPPGQIPLPSDHSHVDILRDNYLELFDKIKVHPVLSWARWLPQFHVWLWSNKQGV